MQSAALHIIVKPTQPSGEVWLSLSGPLVLDNLFGFQKSWREQTAPNIVVDLTDVPYVDSSGIGSLVNLHVSRQKIGGTVELMGISERVKTALMVTRVDKILNIRDASASTTASA
jgi:anti-sigma B factor antagonist